MATINNQWLTARIKDVTTHPQYGWTTSASKSREGLKLLRTTDISSGTIDWGGVPTCVEKPDNINKYLLKTDDILISRAGSVGLSCIIDNPPHSVFASYLIRFRAKQEIIRSKFLYYFFNSPKYWSSIGLGQLGIAVPNVNATTLGDIEISYPKALEQQDNIIKRLDILLPQVTTSCQKIQRAKLLIQKFRQAVLSAAVTGKLTEKWRERNLDRETAQEIVEAIYQKRLKEAKTAAGKKKFENIYSFQEENDSENLPEGWKYFALDKVCESFDYGTSAKSQSQGGVPVLRMGNLQNGEIDWTDLVFTSDEEETKKYTLKPNTVLFNRTNSPELVGKTSIYRGDRPAIFAGYLIRVNNYPELDSEYLNYYLNSGYAKAFCRQVKSDGVSQSNINAQKLGKFEIPFCSIEEQREIVKQVKELLAIADKVEDKVNRAAYRVEKLTQSILAKAFRGELIL